MTYNTKYNDTDTIDFNSIQRVIIYILLPQSSYKLFAVTPNERYKEES